MAGDFLRSHGIDVDAEMARIQFGDQQNTSGEQEDANTLHTIVNASLPKTEDGSTWDLIFSNGKVQSIKPHSKSPPSSSQNHTLNAHSALCAPSLCHPHIHLDKAYLLSHPSYSHLQVQDGSFAEAMNLTSTAKSSFTHTDLLERGQRLIDESVAAGVTHMRCFVEIDAIVNTTCLDAGLELKSRAASAGTCRIQICAFAQLPLFTASQTDSSGDTIRNLMLKAAQNPAVDCLGSTPYVEDSRSKSEQNITHMINLTLQHKKHLDFHLDYTLSLSTPPTIPHVLSTLQSTNWAALNPSRTVVLGHCTRLTLFTPTEWRDLATTIHTSKLPVHFIGLPTSDLYMSASSPGSPRGTLPISSLIQDYNLSAAISVNNIGNAFTPQGSADPMALANLGVGLYGAGTKRGAEIMFESVSTRAREAIGFGRGKTCHEAADDGENDTAESLKPPKGKAYRNNSRRLNLEVRVGDEADLVVWGAPDRGGWKTRSQVAEAVYLYDGGVGRTGVLGGRKIGAGGEG
ncbi:hypothetical protein MBLNU230_g1027t1 [Neophaeotheca triangularis]